MKEITLSTTVGELIPEGLYCFKYNKPAECCPFFNGNTGCGDCFCNLVDGDAQVYGGGVGATKHESCPKPCEPV
jgi:hypothetical protein